MVCYYCGSSTSVINSRHQKRANRVWRRRKCDNCGNVITSLEAVDYAASISFRKSDGSLEPFSRDVLFLSVLDSLRHRKSAVTDATALTEAILARLPDCMNAQGAVVRNELATHVQTVLKRFDTPAGVHYQAYHPAV
jgi:transcriptional regulator NrdR family protein